MRRFVTLLLLPLLACGGGDDPLPMEPPAEPPADPPTEPPPNGSLRAREVVRGLASPVFLTAPAGDARLFVVEQEGRVRIVKDGQLLATPFLDITAKVGSGGERGLLSIAFHPRYAENGFFYVNYTNVDGDTRVERYRVSADADVADPASASPVLAVEQPFANHNGGLVAFGPDGMLYVGMGDGGGAGDPQGNAQRLNTLLGKLLRLDVDGGMPYAVPADNPYVGRADALPEIWASGLRNPWRFAWEAAANRLYVADVGQDAREEVTVVAADAPALNYGWPVLEGSTCFEAASCNADGLLRPTLEYDHGDGCSITGGYVHRGSVVALRGHYFYSDLCGGWLRSARVAADGTVSAQAEWPVGSLGNVTSFGEDGAGELYVISGGGVVYVIEPATAS